MLAICTFVHTMSHNILIAESGSTKTDWCLLQNNKVKKYSTQGINPYFLNEDEIVSIYRTQLKINVKNTAIDEIHFYGAGINSDDKKKLIKTSLKHYFNAKKINTHSDMLASAHSTCQHQKGIACILGTGSNSCYFDGKKISYKTHALGYILGDEGGGNHLGKKLLQYYFHDILDKELKEKFEKKYSITLEDSLEHIYKKPFPNRYLAQFAGFIFENRGNYMIDNIAEDCIHEFFINHLLRYPQIWKVPVHFTGSVSYYLQDIIKEMCRQFNIQFGSVVQKPMKHLIHFYQR